MTLQHTRDDDWLQLALLPPAAMTITVTIGVMHDDNHLQAQIEVRDATTGSLLGMKSFPHRDMQRFTRTVDELLRDVRYVILEATQPF